MAYKFLIDECLSPTLVQIAHAAGHEATSVRDMNWLGLPDRELIQRVVENDYTILGSRPAT